jgi:hypothetical protein
MLLRLALALGILLQIAVIAAGLFITRVFTASMPSWVFYAASIGIVTFGLIILADLVLKLLGPDVRDRPR